MLVKTDHPVNSPITKASQITTLGDLQDELDAALSSLPRDTPVIFAMSRHRFALTGQRIFSHGTGRLLMGIKPIRSVL